MIINRTYEDARLDAIHILSNYENHPTIITIKPIEYDGRLQWALEYKEDDEDDEDDETDS